MFASLQQLSQRVNFFASHCHARIQAFGSMSFFYGINFVTQGNLRTWLKQLPIVGGKLPAYATFVMYSYDLIIKMMDNYKKHPDTQGMSVKTQKLVRTTRTILTNLRLDKEGAQRYLEDTVQMDATQIKRLLDSDISESTPTDSVLAYLPLFRQIHAIRHPTVSTRWQCLTSALNHLPPHLIEPMLFATFDDLDLFGAVRFSPETTLCYVLIVLGLYSFYQTYHYNSQPKLPTSHDLLTCVTDNESLFTHTVDIEMQTHSRDTTPLLFKNPRIPAVAIEQALRDADAPCCIAGLGLG